MTGLKVASEARSVVVRQVFFRGRTKMITCQSYFGREVMCCIPSLGPVTVQDKLF